jgi:hypothetical protein
MLQEGMVEGNACNHSSYLEPARYRRGSALQSMPNLFPDGDNRITDLLDGALQLVFCHSKMSKPATNFGLVLHGNMAAVALALAGKYIAHRLSHPGFKQ